MHAVLSRRLLVVLAAFTLALAMLAAVSPAAQAAPMRDVRVQTKFNGDGSAKVTGYVRWDSKRSALAHLTVDDVCPADGQGAEMQALAKFRYGRVKIDHQYNDGCTDDPYVLLFAPKKPGAGKLRYVRIVACEVTYTQQSKIYSTCSAKKYVNPRG